MSPTPAFYFEQLYPLQDLTLALINQQDTGFYLNQMRLLAPTAKLPVSTRLIWRGDFVRRRSRIEPPMVETYLAELVALGEGLILAK